MVGLVAEQGCRPSPRRTSSTAATGRTTLAKGVPQALDEPVAVPFSFTYDDDQTLTEKVEAIAQRLYGAAAVDLGRQGAAAAAGGSSDDGYGGLPGVRRQDAVLVLHRPHRCAARPSGHALHVREVRLSAGAGFVVLVCGDVMTMPGLPRVPPPPRASTSPTTAPSSGCPRFARSGRAAQASTARVTVTVSPTSMSSARRTTSLSGTTYPPFLGNSEVFQPVDPIRAATGIIPQA